MYGVRRFVLVWPVCLLYGCGGGTIPPDAETVASGLNNPLGLAVMNDGTVLVAESGAGRVVSIGADGQASPLITGFALGTFFPYDIGPMAIVIVDSGTIIVGEGGSPIGMEFVSFFDSAGQPLEVSPLMPVSGGNFQGLAIEPASGDLFIASANTNRIYRAASLGDGTFDFPADFVTNTLDVPFQRAAPTGMVFDAEGALWVGFSDFVNGGIVRVIVNGEELAVESIYESGERIVTALTSRPSDAVLFFGEFHPQRVTEGRIGRIAADGSVSTFSDDVVAPAGLAFNSDDALYVTVLGETPNADAGAVIRLTIETSAAPPDAPPLTP